MSTISVSLPADGETIDVADYNTPINTIVNEINGNLDNSNIDAAAAIDGSKLADNSVDITSKASSFDGWIEVADSWVYASATTITVPTNATTKYSVGDKIKLVQSGNTKYFYITGVAATVLTITGGTDYTLANEAISAINYSKAETPLGFPQYFAYSPTLSGRFNDSKWTKACKFTMKGKTVISSFAIIANTTTPMDGGTAEAIFTLPITSAALTAGADVMKIGDFTILDAGTIGLTGFVQHRSTTSAIIKYLADSGGNTAITSSAPFTWTTSDEIAGIFSYQAA